MLQIRNVVIFVCLNIFLVYAADLIETTTEGATNSLPTCSEKDKNIDDCLLKVLRYIIPRAKNVIPELNTPVMDPFHINRTSYVFSHPLFEGKLGLRNVKIHGVSLINLKRIQYNREGDIVTVKTEFSVPKMFIEGDYKAKIRFNSANISSKGPFNITLININTTTEGSAELYKEGDHVYNRLKSINFNPTIGDMVIKAEGIMPEPLLNDVIVEFMNQNWRSLYKNIIPETRAAWEPETVRLLNEYFRYIPVDAVIKN